MVWLLRSERLRPAELLVEFWRAVGAEAVPQEIYRHACDTLRRLFEADGVVLFRREEGGDHVSTLALSELDWGVFGEFDLEAYPRLRGSVTAAAPVWVARLDELESFLPPPARSNPGWRQWPAGGACA